jgi:hypothetical protein
VRTGFLVDRKRLVVAHSASLRPDGRRWRMRRDHRAHSLYVLMRRWEIVIWYR